MKSGLKEYPRVPNFEQLNTDFGKEKISVLYCKQKEGAGNRKCGDSKFSDFLTSFCRDCEFDPKGSLQKEAYKLWADNSLGLYMKVWIYLYHIQLKLKDFHFVKVMPSAVGMYFTSPYFEGSTS